MRLFASSPLVRASAVKPISASALKADFVDAITMSRTSVPLGESHYELGCGKRLFDCNIMLRCFGQLVARFGLRRSHSE